MTSPMHDALAELCDQEEPREEGSEDLREFRIACVEHLVDGRRELFAVVRAIVEQMLEDENLDSEQQRLAIAAFTGMQIGVRAQQIHTERPLYAP